MDGRLTLSDDCHGPGDVGMHYDKLLPYLQQAKVERLYYLTKNDPAKGIQIESKSLGEIAQWLSKRS
jgi:histidinol-phosphatase (PHP family)